MADQQLPPPLAGDERFSLLLELFQEMLAGNDLGVMAVYLVDQAPAALLPALADQFSLLDEPAWSLAESEDTRRALIKRAIELHRYKGTPWAIREVIRTLGFGEVEILEGLAGLTHDGQCAFDGQRVYGDVGAWPVYRVTLQRPITNDQAAQLRRVLRAIAPARCHLASLDYQSVAIRYNQSAAYNGQYNYGSS
ncbi:phage tail protein I [Pseudomonas aeruginosa]|uniref:phage tail protein I n=1 Tax=Pseudomonas aeruginosa TaxID=287 RepID=UPI0029539A4E|nr:phage tail protein I [Pseudomonas aeruginosa]MDV8137936.1 phage tail protein I [Pseudomonas aeruginosa]